MRKSSIIAAASMLASLIFSTANLSAAELRVLRAAHCARPETNSRPSSNGRAATSWPSSTPHAGVDQGGDVRDAVRLRCRAHRRNEGCERAITVAPEPTTEWRAWDMVSGTCRTPKPESQHHRGVQARHAAGNIHRHHSGKCGRRQILRVFAGLASRQR